MALSRSGGGYGPPASSAVASAFTTTFGATENPISQGGRWVNGAADGLDWLNFQTTGGVACAGANSADPTPPFNDSMAILKSSVFACAADQYVEWIVSRAGGYNPSGLTHELGGFLRFTLTAHSASGYEVYINHSANCTIVRWNGALNDFSPLTGTGPGPTSPADGDVMRFEAQGTTLRLKQNGTTVMTATDATFSSGQAGMQSFAIAGTTLSSYGISQWTCGNL